MTETNGFTHVVVDLDGTLVHTDMLVENLFLFLRTYPWRFFHLFVWLLKGRPYFKGRLADAILPPVNRLPYNEALIAWLGRRRQSGDRLVLATASDHRIAQLVADHLRIFDDVIGTHGAINLSSSRKREALVERYGAGNFEYVGNAHPDLKVWSAASRIHVANPERGVLAAAKKLGEVDQVFDNRPPYLKTAIRGLRVHQWAKNLLVFVPAIAAHRISDIETLWQGMVAFIAFSLCASSVYLLNDLLDLQDDRGHRSKRFRPLAAGTFPILHGVLAIPVLLVLSVAVATAFLSWPFLVVMAVYYVLTLAYSLRLKRIVMLDVVVLAMLYTVRVIAGTAAMTLPPTFWILAFCVFIFLSLAFVKRYTELREARLEGRQQKAAGRGYLPSDYELLAALGGSAGYMSVLILALYINEVGRSGLYQHPEWMWATCPLLLFWLSRVWLLAHRGEMHDDPIVFALRDRVSRWVGVLFFVAFSVASLG
ncbi:UbiA family prenyltransferase [Bordetella sp. LUAb4]|uniref:UbiA family prenyltransferase n=1 Tax=Bordetella sp. LUAb4 TaxID=2843195 RepID=UPI001E34701A|nr:UbiA family prenyltransferase [Bordetella sp. LUAb4]